MSVVRTRYGGQVEVRAAALNWGPTVPRPWSGMQTAAGVPVTTDSAAGIPAVGRAIRLIGGLVGATGISVFQGRRGDKREQPDTAQAMLLDNPYPGMSAFDWRHDIAVALEATGNAFVRKIKTTRGKLVALEVLPPKYVNAYLDGRGDKVFEISTAAGWQRVPPDQILHIRGETVDGGPFGVSRIHQHRDPLGAMLAAQRFEGSYFRNSARPDFVMEFPQGITVEQGRQWKAEWDAAHAGPDQQGQSRAIGGGAKIVPIPISMADAQFIESRNLAVSDVARIMDIEELMIGGGIAEQQDVQAQDRFLAFQLPPRLARIEAALKADPDLFPDGSPLYPQFSAPPLMFASPLTRAQVQHQQIQAGTLLPDEARADDGRPPLPPIPDDPNLTPGMVPQITPVGGAPNPQPPPADTTPSDQAANSQRTLERDTMLIREALRQLPPQTPPQVTVHVPEQRAPEVTVNPEIVVMPAPVTVEAADVVVNVPEQPAPVVNVEAAEVRMPEMTPEIVVNVPEQQAPVVNVQPTPVTVEAMVPQPEIRVDVQVPEQQAPVVNVQPTPITVENVVQPAEQPEVRVDVHVPEQPAPIVNVESAPITVEARTPQQLAPIVNVNVDPTPVTVEAPVTVNVPPAPEPIVVVEHAAEQPSTKRITLKRGPKGQLEGAVVEED